MSRFLLLALAGLLIAVVGIGSLFGRISGGGSGNVVYAQRPTAAATPEPAPTAQPAPVAPAFGAPDLFDPPASFARPVASGRVNGGFHLHCCRSAAQVSRVHPGLDFSARRGAPVLASERGVVVPPAPRRNAPRCGAGDFETRQGCAFYNLLTGEVLEDGIAEVSPALALARQRGASDRRDPFGTLTCMMANR